MRSVGRHRALVRDRAGRLRCALLPSSTPRPGQAVFRPVRAGVCGTDLQILSGERPDAARILGHEALGLLETDGDAGGARPVVLNPVCRADQDRVLGHSYDGVFQDHLLLPVAPEPPLECIDIDDDLVADCAPLVEPLAATLYAWELVEAVVAPTTIGIWGAGAAGLLVALVAERAAVRTHVFHSDSTRFDWLADRGVLGGVVPHPPAGDRLEPLDAAFLCTPARGARAALREAVALTRPGGCLELFGGFGRGSADPVLPGFDLGAVRRHNVAGETHGASHVAARTAAGKVLSITGQRGTNLAHLRRAHDALRAEPERFAPLISHVTTLEHACELINRRRAGARTDRNGEPIVKIVVDFDQAVARRRGTDLSTTVRHACQR